MSKYIEEYESEDNFCCNDNNVLFDFCKLCKDLSLKNRELVRFLLGLYLNYLKRKNYDFYLVPREKNDSSLLDWLKDNWKNIFNIGNMILCRGDIGFVRDDKYKNQFDWLFGVYKEDEKIYIKITFTNNTIKIISLHKTTSFNYCFRNSYYIEV